MPEHLYIAVVGGGKASAAEREQAQAIGRGIAEAGAALVCGGLGGVMEAACEGARSAGGLTIGILPGTERSDANRFVDVALPSGLGEARNALVVRAADAVIAVSGEFGTLSEIALALATGVPVVGLGTWELSRGGEQVDAIVRVDTPDAAVTLAIELAVEKRRSDS
ncbi:MAG TPA: TIGR00725 family protein [Acidimicrobiales bacterium]|nr:TIGR00725 family protein [Acidimicrobiales bacterium]